MSATDEAAAAAARALVDEEPLLLLLLLLLEVLVFFGWLRGVGFCAASRCSENLNRSLWPCKNQGETGKKG